VIQDWRPEGRKDESIRDWSVRFRRFPTRPRTQSHGHAVLALARSDTSAQKLQSAGYEIHRGSLDDLDSLRSGVRSADGVIHTAFKHDFSRYKESVEDDLRVVEAMGEVLAGTGKHLVITGGTTVVTAHTPGLETDPADPKSFSFPRVASEEAIKSLSRSKVFSEVELFADALM